ncbi:Rz1-like lysis system protein LysC [Pseudomonas entomophila]|uniref:Rz1-like lysis system protein LysC n=1 Tax=Pseudomonas entomophila TaxID=312306 RepID=UPI0031F2F570
MTRNCAIGALSLCLTLLAGCTSGRHSPEPTVIVSGCPVVTPCTLNPAAPTRNDELSDDNDYLLSAWAECAAKVDSVIQYRPQVHKEAK